MKRLLNVGNNLKADQISVDKYRQYDEDRNEILGGYGQMLEHEYVNVFNEYLNLSDIKVYLFTPWLCERAGITRMCSRYVRLNTHKLATLNYF